MFRNRKTITTLAISGLLAIGAAGPASAKHGADDGPGHHAGDDTAQHHGRHGADDGAKHRRGRGRDDDHRGGRKGRGADDAPGHERHGDDDGPNHH